MNEALESAKKWLVEDTKDDNTVPYYCGIEITPENFSFGDLMRMLKAQKIRYKQEVKNWKLCVELYRNKR
jgi:hypothetical protein